MDTVQTEPTPPAPASKPRGRQPLPVVVVTDEAIARHLRVLVDESGISGKALAAAIGMPETNFRRRLSGETAWSAAEVTRLATAIGRPLVETLPASVRRALSRHGVL